jgi:hypothetical protein
MAGFFSGPMKAWTDWTKGILKELLSLFKQLIIWYDHSLKRRKRSHDDDLF